MAKANKILLVYIGFDVIFLGSAVLHLLIPLFTQSTIGQAPTVRNVAATLLLGHCPLTATMVNAFIMFFVFLLSLPPLLMPKIRLLLTLHAWGVIICAVFSLCIGLKIWFSTLQMHANLAPIWNGQSTLIRSMLQYKFKCCGYNDPTLFVQDQTCPNAGVAAQLSTCSVPFGAYANSFLNIIFTAFFAFVAVDVMLLLSVMCLIKDRAEKARYVLIDEKRGVRSL